MSKLLSIGFEFKGNSYSTLIRVKEKEDCNEYKVTIMNGDLERLLYGEHIITEVCGKINDDIACDDSTEQYKLRQVIVKSLSAYLHLLSVQKLK